MSTLLWRMPYTIEETGLKEKARGPSPNVLSDQTYSTSGQWQRGSQCSVWDW